MSTEPLLDWIYGARRLHPFLWSWFIHTQAPTYGWLLVDSSYVIRCNLLSFCIG